LGGSDFDPKSQRLHIGVTHFIITKERLVNFGQGNMDWVH